MTAAAAKSAGALSSGFCRTLTLFLKRVVTFSDTHWVLLLKLSVAPPSDSSSRPIHLRKAFSGSTAGFPISAVWKQTEPGGFSTNLPRDCISLIN